MLARVNRELGVTVIMSTHTPEDGALRDAHHRRGGGRRCGDARAGGSRASPALEKPEVATALRAHGMREERANCVRVREAMFRYEKNSPWVLRGVDLQVRRGSVHALVGGNGSARPRCSSS